MRDTQPQTPPVPFDAHLHLSKMYVRKLRILKDLVSWNLALDFDVIQEKQAYDIRLHRDHRSVDLISVDGNWGHI